MKLIKQESFCTAKTNKQTKNEKQKHRQTEKTTYRMGENICKLYDWCGLFLKIYKQLMLLNRKTKETDKQLNQKLDRFSVQFLDRNIFGGDIPPKKTYQWPRGTWKDAQLSY